MDAERIGGYYKEEKTLNRLSKEKSPYLLQHKDNPVGWYPWGEEAFQKAKQEDKPVFLSIGYSTCHWCHVMAHESFEDEEVAKVLNRDYICVKVDREERPDIDAVYMSVCQAVTGSGGWPLTIFLTPEQKPFFAGTYFPKQGRYGQFGLIELLERVAYLWKNERQELLRAGNEITQAIIQSQSGSKQEPDRAIVETAYSQLQRRFDHQWGGFGTAPKFPTPHNLLFLMRFAHAMQESDAMKMATVTLEDMARGGIHDHIGGGFSRYSTDENWLVPHFEKMLYDNALLLIAYVTAYQHTKEEHFADVAHRTADYILRELTDAQGGFYCGQDADSEGVEGKYYVFTPEEIKEVLEETDGVEFCRLYDITDSGNFEGKSIPNRINATQDSWNREDPRLRKLYDYRLQRTQLHKDDKILLSWNGWTIIALTKAGQALGEKRYLDGAIKAHQFIRKEMTDENDRLYLRWRDGEAAHFGQLDDYVVYALSLLELYRVTLNAAYLQEAIHRAEQMTGLFEDSQGGYFMTAADSEQLIARPKETYDGAIPSGNSVVAMVLQRLASLTGEMKWRDAAERQMKFLAATIGQYPASSCFGVLAMMDALYPHRELVCAVKDGLPTELGKYLAEHPTEDLQVLLKTESNAELLAQCAPFARDYPVPEEGAMYYLCENGACKAPVKSLTELGL